jgi:hypothetical protein
MLQVYFGSELKDYHRARLFLMQQANRILYAMVIFNFIAAANPQFKAKVERSKTNTIERSAGRNGKVAGSNPAKFSLPLHFCVRPSLLLKARRSQKQSRR